MTGSTAAQRVRSVAPHEVARRSDVSTLTGSPPCVLMVTGAYYPEMSGAGLQCRALIAACGDRARFEVLTTAIDPSLPERDVVDGVPVHRVLVHATSRVRRAMATPRWAAATRRALQRADIVHLHGFSAKSRIVMWMARRRRIPVVLKLTSVGHDDAVSMSRAGGAAWRSFRRADRFVGVSPRFGELHADAQLPPERFQLIPNGVDLDRFSPASAATREAIRRELGWPADRLTVLFVGFFSREKRPDLAFEAWRDANGSTPPSTLVFVGRTRSTYYEVDAGLADRIRREAARHGLSDRIVFVERSDAVERLYQAADVLLFPSTREGLPNVLLEAMACGVPCIATRLPRVTDALFDDGVDGVLIEADDRRGFGQSLARLLGDADLRRRMGTEARRTAESRLSIAGTAAAYLALYRELVSAAR